MLPPEIKVCLDAAAIATEAADRIAAAATEAIAAKGSFLLSLSGGSTPKRLYELLATEPYRSRIDWVKTEIFFSDERGVPPDHAESNYRMAREAMLSKLPIPGDNINRIKGELEATAAADAYETMLRTKLGDGGFDLTLLGIGDDGHTASIFPHTPAVHEKSRWVVGQFVDRSTTGKSWRITTTAPFLNRSALVLFLVAGASKAKAVSQILEGATDVDTYPAQLIDPAQTRVVWILDATAAAMDEDD